MLLELWKAGPVTKSSMLNYHYQDMTCLDSQKNQRGGVLLYVKSYMKAAEFTTVSDFSEQVWCHLLDHHRHSFYIIVCYRTPNNSIYGM